MSEDINPPSTSPTLSGLAVGNIIDDKYRILEPIGKGGTGVVYKAEHILISRIVALKVLHPHLVENEDSLKRFQHEAKVASRLNHPNAVLLYDFGIHNGLPYLVMQYVQGRTLKEKINTDGALPFRYIYQVFKQVGSALAEAHRLGIIHRDLKPENIMITSEDGGEERVLVLDFGIAKLLLEGGAMTATVVTQAGLFYGTPHYASPEQVLSKELDIRSDIYSLGVILYEALSGELPFNAPSLMEILLKQLNEQPLGISAKKPWLHLSKRLEEVVMKCLEKDPGARYQNVEALLEALRTAEQEVVAKRRGNKTMIVAGGGVFALLVAGISALFWTSTPEDSVMQNDAQSTTQGTQRAEISPEKVEVKSRKQSEEKPVVVTDSTDKLSAEKSSFPEKTTLGSFVDSIFPTEAFQEVILGTDKAPDKSATDDQVERPIEVAKVETGEAIELPTEQSRSWTLSPESDLPAENIPSTNATTENTEVGPTDVVPPTTSTGNSWLGPSSSTQDVVAERITLNINSSPSGAEVFIEGSLRGGTPLSLNDLEAREYELVLKKDQYLEHRERVVLEAGKIHDLNITLRQTGERRTLRIQAELAFEEGEKLYRERRYQEAIVELEEAVRLKPDHLKARLSLGTCYLRLKRNNAALEQFQAAARLDPNYAPVHFNLACYYALNGQADKAIDELERTIRLNPRSRSWATREPDLASLRNNPRFKSLVGR